jgi:hypothetical protein
VKKRRSINQKSCSSIEGITVLIHDKARSAYIGRKIRKIYTDASYEGEQSQSQTGVIMLMHGNIVTWYTRRQDAVALSLTEAEYIAACEGAKDAAWVRQWMMEFGEESIPIPWIDNDAAEKLSKAQSFHRRTRHIEHQFHYLRQEVTNGNLKMCRTTGHANLADALTKIEASIMLKEWMKSIGIDLSDSENEFYSD